MKKYLSALSFLLAVVILTALFAGCGNSGGNGSSSAGGSESAAPAESTAAATETPAEMPGATGEPAYFPLAEPETLSMFVGYFPLITYDEGDGIAILNYLSEATNVELELTAVSMVFAAEQFNIMISSGDYADLLEYADAFYPGGCVAAYEDEVILSLNDYLDSYLPNYNAILESNDAYKMNAYNDDGDLLMFYCLSDTDSQSTEGLFLRGDWLEDLGIESPVTYDDYHDMLTAFKVEKNADAALWIAYDGVNMGHNAWSSGFGFPAKNYEGEYAFYVDDNRVQFSCLNENFKTFLTTMNQWWSEGLIWKDFMSSTSADPDEGIISSGRCGVWGDDITDLDTWNSAITDENVSVIGGRYPVVKEGDVNGGGHAYRLVSNMGMSISTGCENVELAARFMDFWYSEEGLVICNWGKEDVTFERDENGDPYFTDLIMNNEMGQTAAMAFYTIMVGPFMEDFRRTTNSLSDAALEAMATWTDSATGAFYLPATMTLTTQETEAFNGYYTDILTLYSESIVKFITGEMNLEADFDNFIAQLKNMGVEKCVEIYQTAYDRYLARG